MNAEEPSTFVVIFRVYKLVASLSLCLEEHLAFDRGHMLREQRDVSVDSHENLL